MSAMESLPLTVVALTWLLVLLWALDPASPFARTWRWMMRTLLRR